MDRVMKSIGDLLDNTGPIPTEPVPRYIRKPLEESIANLPRYELLEPKNVSTQGSLAGSFGGYKVFVYRTTLNVGSSSRPGLDTVLITMLDTNDRSSLQEVGIITLSETGIYCVGYLNRRLGKNMHVRKYHVNPPEWSGLRIPEHSGEIGDKICSQAQLPRVTRFLNRLSFLTIEGHNILNVWYADKWEIPKYGSKFYSR